MVGWSVMEGLLKHFSLVGLAETMWVVDLVVVEHQVCSLYSVVEIFLSP
jgi:hypothetical protein